MKTHEYQLFSFASLDAEEVAKHKTRNLTTLDEKVNALLVEGWEILSTSIEPNSNDVGSYYYAATLHFFCRRPLPGYCHICRQRREFPEGQSCSECGRGRPGWPAMKSGPD